MGSEEIEPPFLTESSYESFLPKSFGENLAINLGLIFVTIVALILSMMLLPHLMVGVTWNGG